MLNTKAIKRLRARRGLTQAACAKAVGMKAGHDWYRVETGRAGLSLARLVKVAKLFQCKVDDLLTKT